MFLFGALHKTKVSVKMPITEFSEIFLAAEKGTGDISSQGKHLK